MSQVNRVSQDAKRKAFKFRILSWNMLKGPNRGGNNWSLLEKELQRNARRKDGEPVHEILALQNCDEMLKSFEPVKYIISQANSAKRKILDKVPDRCFLGDGYTGTYVTICYDETEWKKITSQSIKEYKWECAGITYYIYHLVSGVGAINMAIMSCYKADEVILYKRSQRVYKPIIGIRIGTRIFINVEQKKSHVFLDVIIRGIEAKILAPRSETPTSFTCVILGSFTKEIHLFRSGYLLFTQQFLSERVHSEENVFTFAAICRGRLVKQLSLRCNVFAVDGAYCNPIVFEYNDLKQLLIDCTRKEQIVAAGFRNANNVG